MGPETGACFFVRNKTDPIHNTHTAIRNILLQAAEPSSSLAQQKPEIQNHEKS